MDFFRIETLYKEVVNGLPDGDLSKAEKQHLKGAFRGIGTKRFIGNIIFTIKSHKKSRPSYDTKHPRARRFPTCPSRQMHCYEVQGAFEQP
jgi:hypothetical protein